VRFSRFAASKKGEPRPLDPTKPIGNLTSAWNTLRERCAVGCRLHGLGDTAVTKMAEARLVSTPMSMGRQSQDSSDRGVAVNFEKYGAPGEIRTPDLLIRSRSSRLLQKC
jgi:hypothetical protein